MSPGIIPARNRSLTDAPEAMPYMMNGILGGMITPSPPATGNDRSRKCQIITKIGQDWNRHTSNSSNRCRSRTGDRTVKKAGDDYGTWHTSSEFAKKIGKNIKQLFGNTALGHDDTGKDKHWNCQEREGVQTAKHGTNQIFGTNSKGRDQTQTEEQM